MDSLERHANIYQNDNTGSFERAVRVVTAFYPPFVKQVSPDISNVTGDYKCGQAKLCEVPKKNQNGTVTWTVSCCTGYIVDSFEMVQRKLNFEYTLYIVEDGKWGTLENETWNGMIGDLVDKKADLIINIMTPLEIRAKDIHFTHHFMESNFGIVRVKEYNSDIPSFDFLKPVGGNLHFAILASTILTLLTISFLENYFLKFTKKQGVFFQETMAYVFGLTFQRDMGGTNPRMWSGRLTALGYASAMTIIMSVYTARITANSIGQVVMDDFKGFKDKKFQNPSEDYKFTLVGGQGWAIESFFRDHPDESFQRMYKFMSKYFVKTEIEGVKKLLDGTIQAYIADSGSFPVVLQRITSELGCPKEIELLEESFIGTHGLSFAYRKNFPYGKTISNTLLGLYQTGALIRLRKKWFPSSHCKGKTPVQQFDWTYFSGILVIVGYTVIIGIFVNLIEHFYMFLRKMYKSKSADLTEQKRSTKYTETNI
eukprot:TCONS_00000718-protein